MADKNLSNELTINNEISEKWTNIINLLADLFDVSTALIIQIKDDKIEVLLKNNNTSNPYNIGDSMILANSGLYCENVIKNQNILYVKNALKDEKWCNNPDIELNMINYLGFPISFKNGEYFGTICLLDSNEKIYSQTQIRLLNEFKNAIETDLEQICTYIHLVKLEKMAGLGELVAGITHEINTPLGIGVTAITHFQEITKDLQNKFNKEEMSLEDFSTFIETSNELSNIIYTNLSKADSLVKSFKQISVDQSIQDKREFNLKEYLEEILLSISSIINKTNIKIECTCDKDISIYADAGSFSQIISNLIINSLTHAYEKEEEGTISIFCEKQDKELIIIYKDNGKGINKKNIKKIFEAFFTTNRKNGGTGLGLHMIYNIINQTFNGSIICKSEENKGLEFIIKLNNV